MAEDNFDELCHLRPVLDNDGQPVMSSGNFAVVFKMRDTESGKFHAVRCFHREQEGRTESYRQIEEALRQVQSPYLVSFRYMDKELFVDSKQTGSETEFPVLLMDWVEGVTLDRYIREHIDDKDALEVLAYRFSLMASWLIAQPFAHGDLKPDNILVRPDGTITLVDYDGMFVPSMQGQTARELGSPDFRHPLRKEADFDGSIDDFPLVSILLSLKAVAATPSLLDQFGASDRLLFSEADYRDISKCRVLHEIFPSEDNELNTLVGLFTLSLNKGRLIGIASDIYALTEPNCLINEQLSTEASLNDWMEAIIDEFGATYSKDGKRLLKGVENVETYSVRAGTEVICDRAFLFQDDVCNACSLTIIHLPDSIKKIGKYAFAGCLELTNVFIPEGLTEIEKYAFSGCYALTNIHIPNSVYNIGEFAFSECSITKIDIPNNISIIEKHVFEGCQELVNINIPNNVKEIADFAFWKCTKLSKVNIPNTITRIGIYAFSKCHRLENINIPDRVIEIGRYAFSECSKLTNINIPNSVTEIGEGAFHGCDIEKIVVEKGNAFYESIKGSNAIVCTNISYTTLILGCKNTIIPNNVVIIGKYAFGSCLNMTSINIPDNVTKIEDGAFSFCSGLTNINIPNSVTEIGNGTFLGCSRLKHIKLPVQMIHIGMGAFSGCSELTEIYLPHGLTEICNSIFHNCSKLKNVNMPYSIRKIENSAFSGCSELVNIIIPENVKRIENWVFENCYNLEYIEFFNNIEYIGKDVFRGCERLAHIYIPHGTIETFANLLPDYKHLLTESGHDFPF